MNRITSEEIKGLHKQSGLSYRFVFTTIGINKSWYTKMVEGKFSDPDPKRMIVIRDYLHEVIRANIKVKEKEVK